MNQLGINNRRRALAKRAAMVRDRYSRVIRIGRNHDGSYLLTFTAVKGADGHPLTARCVSIPSVKRTLTRWTRQHGPAKGLDFTDAQAAYECGRAMVGVEVLVK